MSTAEELMETIKRLRQMKELVSDPYIEKEIETEIALFEMALMELASD